MLKSAAVNILQRDLGFRTDLETDGLRELQDAQDEFEKLGIPSRWGNFWPWFLITENAEAFTTVGEERVPLPSDFLLEVEESKLWWLDETATNEEDVWNALGKGDVATLRDQWPGSGPPEAYALDNKYFRIFPTPDDTYKLSMSYYGQAEVLGVEDSENVWLKFAPSVLIGRAGERLATTLRDEMAIRRFQDRFVIAVETLFRLTEERKHSARRYVMGGTAY